MSSTPAGREALRLAGHLGVVISDARRTRHWTLRDLSERCGLAVSSMHAIEHGRPASLSSYAAIAAALGLDFRLDLADPRVRAHSVRADDPVHAAMGEVLARRMPTERVQVAIDEPFQHYQFAGRADVLAWDPGRRALLHVENRTRFPNVQEAMGSYNVKRRYLPGVLADRWGVRGGFRSVTHVLAGIWSAEVLHVARLRSATLRAVCPDGIDGFEAWWSGSPPGHGDPTSTFILLDPMAVGGGRRRPFVGLDEALDPSLRARYRGYADAAEALRRSGLA